MEKLVIDSTSMKESAINYGMHNHSNSQIVNLKWSDSPGSSIADYESHQEKLVTTNC